MKVICVGLGKTGISSLATALRVLGYNVAEYDEQIVDFVDHWYDVFHGADLDVRHVYGKYDAAIDTPCYVFFEEIIKEYPDVKVILSLRSEDSWVKARVEQWKKNKEATPALWSFSPYYRKHKFVDESCLYAALGEATNGKNTNILRKRFRIHNDRVRSVVRKQNLLEYSVKDGWKPLCEFLGCAIPPGAPFPHENIKGENTKKFFTKSKYAIQIDREFQKVKVLLALVFIVFAVCGVYLLASH